LSFSRSTRFRLIIAMGIACLLMGSAIPTAMHVHDGGDQLHCHDELLTDASAMPHSHGADSASCSHSHRSHGEPAHHKHSPFGHAHRHTHDHENSTLSNSDAKATEVLSRNRLPRSSNPHVHLVIFGFEFTLTLPHQKSAPVEKVLKRNGSSTITIVRQIPLSATERLRAIGDASAMAIGMGSHLIAYQAPSGKFSIAFPILLVPPRVILQTEADAGNHWSRQTDDHYISVVPVVEPPPPRIVPGLI